MSASPQKPNEDPLLRGARRESLVVFGVWLAALTYTMGYCYWFGYGRAGQTPTLWFGVPGWVLWGIVLPWSLCTAVSWWFGLWFMADDDLGGEPIEEAGPGEAAHE